MKDKLIIIAAGSSSRWDNYLGTTKHLVEVDGETILERQVRLFNMDTTIIGYNERYKVKGAKLIIPDEVGKQDVNKQCYQTADLWGERTIITLGDVFFTEEAVKTIKDHKKRDMHFFGREKEGITCPYGELFAHSFYPEHQEDYVNAYLECEELYKKGKIKRCEWWEHYRICQGIDPNIVAVGDMFTEINDLTDDFDKPQDYDVWKTHYYSS